MSFPVIIAFLIPGASPGIASTGAQIPLASASVVVPQVARNAFENARSPRVIVAGVQSWTPNEHRFHRASLSKQRDRVDISLTESCKTSGWRQSRSVGASRVPLLRWHVAVAHDREQPPEEDDDPARSRRTPHLLGIIRCRP